MSKSKQLELPEYVTDENLTAQQNAYRRLHHALLVGAIPPGQAITIRGLAQATGLSPTPVREALRRLSSLGGLSVLENRRIIVPKMTRQRFEELLLARVHLEMHAAERALPFVSDKVIEQLQEIDQQINGAYERGNLVDSIIHNYRFHRALYLTNPEQVLIPMIESLWLQLGPFLRIAAGHVKEFYQIDRHLEILAALRSRDLDALKAALTADINDAAGGLQNSKLVQLLPQ